MCRRHELPIRFSEEGEDTILTRKSARLLAKLSQVPDPVWIGLILLIALALRLYQLGEQSLWFDETHSWFQTTLPLRDCLKDIAPYPPLYYILMRPVALIGRSEFWLRFSSVATGVVGVAITYRAGRQLEGRRLGLLAALLCALNPFHLWYSQEFRYYALEYLLEPVMHFGP